MPPQYALVITLVQSNPQMNLDKEIILSKWQPNISTWKIKHYYSKLLNRKHTPKHPTPPPTLLMKQKRVRSTELYFLKMQNVWNWEYQVSRLAMALFSWGRAETHHPHKEVTENPRRIPAPVTSSNHFCPSTLTARTNSLNLQFFVISWFKDATSLHIIYQCSELVSLNHLTHGENIQQVTAQFVHKNSLIITTNLEIPWPGTHMLSHTHTKHSHTHSHTRRHTQTRSNAVEEGETLRFSHPYFLNLQYYRII